MHITLHVFDYYKEKTKELAFPPEKKEAFIAEVNKKQHQGIIIQQKEMEHNVIIKIRHASILIHNIL